MKCWIRLCVALLCLRVPAEDHYRAVFSFARQLERQGAQKEAATEYKRYLFLQDFQDSAQAEHLQESLAALALHYAATEQTERALSYTRLALGRSATPSAEHALQRQEIELLLSRSLQSGAPLQAEPAFAAYLRLDSYADTVRNYALCALLEFLIRTNQPESFEAELAYSQDALHAMLTEEERQVIAEGISRYQAFSPKNPDFAMWLSVLPGAGQLYAHNAKDAANAFLLNGVLIAFDVYSVLQMQLWDFALFGFSPTFRFYTGNMRNARKAAEVYNEAKYAEIWQPVEAVLRSARQRYVAQSIGNP